jgi:hypothetical protein
MPNYGTGPYGGGPYGFGAGPLAPDYGLDQSAPQPDPTAHLVDRYYMSQFDASTVGITVFVAGVQGDPDGNSVTVSMYDINDNVVFSQLATRSSLGNYQMTFTTEQSAVPGFYTLAWDFTINSQAQELQTYIQIGATNPAYDKLDAGMKGIVESVWIRFADMFDSPQGGPHLQVFFQTAFSRGRLAQLLQIALNKINLTMQPAFSFALTPGSEFPYQDWGGLLEQGLYIETIRHLIRSYVEMPMPTGVTVSRMDRRDFSDRWQNVYEMENADYMNMLSDFKVQCMFLSRPRVLVSGGAYGNWGPTRLPGSAAARGVNRVWAAYY